MNDSFDDAVWSGVARRLTEVESFIPDRRPWRPADELMAPVTARVGRGPAFGPMGRTRAVHPLAWALLAVGLILAIVVGAVLVGATRRQAFVPDHSGRNGLVAYEGIDPNNGAGTRQLLLTDGSGAIPRPFIAARADDQSCPAFSPDGRKLAYLGPSGKVRMAQVDGSLDRAFSGVVVSEYVTNRGPNWSPDGLRIAVAAKGVANNNALAIVTVSDGSVVTTSFTTVERLYDVAWSPDGSRIAVLGYGGDTTQEHSDASLFIVDANGSNVRRITQYSNGPSRPLGHITWSPDGLRLAYSRWAVGPTLTNDIYVIGADGQDDTNLTHSAGDDLFPAWSPDGRRIAYVSADALGSTNALGSMVTTMNPDGTDQVVVDRGTEVSGVVWSPDSSRLLITPAESGFASSPPIRSVMADGTGTPVSLGQDLGNCLPSWRRLDP